MICQFRLPMPFDAITFPLTIIGTEMKHFPGSKILFIERMVVPGEHDAAIMVVYIPDEKSE